MGLYADHLLPRLVDRTCGVGLLQPLRRTVCQPLHGRALEIGFGSGHNAAHYPPAVTEMVAVEPSDLAWRLAGARVAAATVPVRRSGLDGQQLPFADASFDSALSTFTLCTIPGLDDALREVSRVLRPGGVLCFLEHGLAPEARVAARQRRLEPLQKRVAGGCHLTRDVPRALEQAGFRMTSLERFHQPGTPRVMGCLSLGTAVPNA